MELEQDANRKSWRTELDINTALEQSSIRDSIVVSISACHADDPGSIPGRGAFPFCEPLPTSLPKWGTRSNEVWHHWSSGRIPFVSD